MSRFSTLFCVFITALCAQAFGRVADSTVYTIYKFENPVGRERCRKIPGQGRVVFDVDYKIDDRGTAEHLASRLVLSAVGDPLSFALTGATSNATRINDTITRLHGDWNIKIDSFSYTKSSQGPVFPIAGCLPATLQQELITYWLKLGKPATVITLPYSPVKIKDDGNDSFLLNGRRLSMKRYVVSGLVWGNEYLWTDLKGRLIGLITNDNLGDKVEIVSAKYAGLLPQLVRTDALAGTLRLASTGKPPFITSKLIAITGATLVDVSGKANVPNSVILIRDGQIQATGKLGELQVPAEATVIDAAGKYILPGLWDMHAHFGQAEWEPAYLAAGITTVRDCTNEPDYINPVKNAIDGGRGIGPSIIKAGLIDGKGPRSLGRDQVDNHEEAVAAVGRFKEDGYAQIKIYSEVKPALVKAICAEAHRDGLTVTGHIPEGMTLKQGVDSGMDMVNHIYYVYSAMKLNKDHSINFEDSLSKATIRFLQEHRTVVDPTIGSMELNLRSAADSIQRIEPAFYALPRPLQVRLKTITMSEALAKKYQPMYASMLRLIKVLFDAGVPLVAGSDQGFPGYSLDRELELYVAAGLTPLQALQSATVVPATAMNLFSQCGSVSAGKAADLLLLDADPTENISNLRKVFKVVRGNRVYDPSRLRYLAGFSR